MTVDPRTLSQAERLLWGHGVREPDHIDLEAIASVRGARVVFRRLDGCAARLVRSGDSAVISVAVDSVLGRQRFSLGHELAHWICDSQRSSFKCTGEDIGPQNAEAKSVEADANSFASQLILPNYLVEPWSAGRKLTLDVADALAKDFRASLTASAIKLVKRANTPACVVCHGQQKLRWFQKNSGIPLDFYLRRELHQDTPAFDLVFGAMTGMSRPRKEPADRWFSGPNAYRMTVQTQSVKLPDATVLTLLAFA